MPWLPHSDRDRREMLDAMGVSSVEELFADIPAALRETATPELPPPLTEMELVAEARRLSAQNRGCDELVCFAAEASTTASSPRSSRASPHGRSSSRLTRPTSRRPRRARCRRCSSIRA
jgi:glycine cleavage system pyridoxal-binding protein P